MLKKTNKHYVDNKEFYKAMVLFLDERKKDPHYKIPSYIGECIYKICTKITYSPNFINYSFRSEMEGMAIENCIRYIDRFNPEKSKNPFSYYSSIAWYACVFVINKERKVMDVKAAIVQSGSVYRDSVDCIEAEDQEYFNPESLSTLEYLYNHKIPEPEKTKKKEVISPMAEFL